MKKQLTIVSIIITLFTVIFAIPLFNEYSIALVSDYNTASADDTVWGHVIVERDYAALDPYFVHQVMEEEAIKNNLIIYQLVQNYDDSGNAEIGLYVTKNETVLAKHILLAKGKLDKLDEVYSTMSVDKAHRIANIMYTDKVVTVNPFVTQQDSGGYLYFKNLNGQMEENVSSWIDGITQRLGPVYVHEQHELANFGYGNVGRVDLFSNKLIKLTLSILLVIYLCLTMFQLYQKVAYYKLDGHSNTTIYWLLFEKDFLMISMLCLLLLLAYSLFEFAGSMNTLKVFVAILLSQWLQLIVAVQCLSYALIIICACIPMIASSKGKNYLDEVLFLGFIGKFVVTLILIPLILPNISNIKQVSTMVKNHDQAYRQYDHMYRFGSQVASAWVTDMGSENVIRLYDDIASHTGMFHFGMGVMKFDDENQSNMELVYMGNWEYLLANNLVSSDDDPSRYRIFLTENIKDKKQYYLDYYLNRYQPYGVSEDMFDIRIIEPGFRVYDYEQLLFAEQLYNLPIVYIPVEKGLEGQVYKHLFYYDGPLSQAQQYINEKFMEYGYAPMFRITNEQTNFQHYYLTILRDRVKQIIKFVFIVFAYLFVSMFMLDCDYELHHKKYRLAYFEGQFVYQLPGYLLRFLSPFLLGLIALMSLNRLHLNSELVGILGVVTCIEVIIYLFYMYRCTHQK